MDVITWIVTIAGSAALAIGFMQIVEVLEK